MSPCNDDKYHFIIASSDDDNYAAVTAAANEELVGGAPVKNPRLCLTRSSDDELSTTEGLNVSQGPTYTDSTTPSKEYTASPEAQLAPVTPSPNPQNPRHTVLGMSDADRTKLSVSNTLDDAQAHFPAPLFGGAGSFDQVNPTSNEWDPEPIPEELSNANNEESSIPKSWDINQVPTDNYSSIYSRRGEWRSSVDNLDSFDLLDFEALDSVLDDPAEPTIPVTQVPTALDQTYPGPQEKISSPPAPPNHSPKKRAPQVPISSSSKKKPRLQGKIKSTPPPSTHSTFIEEKDIDRTVSVVRGQGNNDKGMKKWIGMTERVRVGADESNHATLARQVVMEFKREGGRFFDKKLVGVCESGSKKKEKYFEMSDADAVKLTMEALRREYTSLKQDVDVVMGRGGGGNHNPGNHAWREEIRVNKPLYRATPSGNGRRNEKTNISRQIVANVYQRGGRFLTDEDSIKGKFYPVPTTLPVKKTSQALRERRTQN